MLDLRNENDGLHVTMAFLNGKLAINCELNCIHEIWKL